MPTWSKSNPGPATPAQSDPLTRRSLLGSSGRVATLAAARALAPAVFTGCAVNLPQGADPIVVGLLHSQTGTLAISETSLRDAELFAIEEINASGGLLGRQLAVQVRADVLLDFAAIHVQMIPFAFSFFASESFAR